MERARRAPGSERQQRRHHRTEGDGQRKTMSSHRRKDSRDARSGSRRIGDERAADAGLARQAELVRQDRRAQRRVDEPQTNTCRQIIEVDERPTPANLGQRLDRPFVVAPRPELHGDLRADVNRPDRRHEDAARADVPRHARATEAAVLQLDRDIEGETVRSSPVRPSTGGICLIARLDGHQRPPDEQWRDPRGG